MFLLSVSKYICWLQQEFFTLWCIIKDSTHLLFWMSWHLQQLTQWIGKSVGWSHFHIFTLLKALIPQFINQYLCERTHMGKLRQMIEGPFVCQYQKNFWTDTKIHRSMFYLPVRCWICLIYDWSVLKVGGQEQYESMIGAGRRRGRDWILKLKFAPCLPCRLSSFSLNSPFSFNTFQIWYIFCRCDIPQGQRICWVDIAFNSLLQKSSQVKMKIFSHVWYASPTLSCFN